MGLSINFNSTNSNLVRSIGISSWRMGKSAEKLSSGWIINSASDGPATLIISEHLRGQIGSLNQQIENIDSQMAKYHTASSATYELRSILTEMRSLAVGAANEGGNSEASQQAYELMAQHLTGSYNRQIENAEFAGTKLLDGSERSLANISELSEIDLSSADAAEASLSRIDQAMDELDTVQIDLGATEKYDLESRRNSLAIERQNLTAAESTLRDTDYALELSKFIGESFKMKAAMAMLSQSFLLGSSVVKMMGFSK